MAGYMWNRSNPSGTYFVPIGPFQRQLKLSVTSMSAIQLLSRRNLLILIALGGIGCFATGVVLSNFAHLAACPLCILQRMLYLSIGLFALAGLLFQRNRLIQRPIALVLLSGAGLGAFIAGYQSWLQHHPAAASCSANSPWWEDLVFWAGEKLPSLFLSSGMCSDPGFVLFGLSIAEYSIIIFSSLAVVALCCLVRKS